MPARPVLVFPDPVLKRTAEPCGSVNDEDLTIVEDLIDTMRAHSNCVGLSAPQIGVLKRIIVVDVTGHPKAEGAGGLRVVLDPVITSAGGSEIGREGCLSLPSITANVRRATDVTLRGLETDGSSLRLTSAGFEARVLQHEIDHLDGILILDRVTSPSEVFPRKK